MGGHFRRHRCPACGRRMYPDHSQDAAANGSSPVPGGVVGLVCVNADCLEFGITVHVIAIGTTWP